MNNVSSQVLRKSYQSTGNNGATQIQKSVRIAKSEARATWLQANTRSASREDYKLSSDEIERKTTMAASPNLMAFDASSVVSPERLDLGKNAENVIDVQNWSVAVRYLT